MNVGGFSKHQSKRSDTVRYKRSFFFAHVSQVNLKTIKRLFEQRNDEGLMIHVLSNSYDAPVSASK